MIKNVNPYKISQIFEIDNKIVYKIPKYQREYTWGINEWDQLFDDVITNDEGYFLGSYICVSMQGMGVAELEVIDGQQRFTTLSILLTAIYSKLNAKRDQLDDEDISNLTNIKKQLTYSPEKGVYRPKLRLQVQNSNADDYLSLLYENNIISDKIKRPNNAGNRRIYKAFKHFNKCIDDYITDDINKGKDEVELLFKLKDKFNEAIIVGIEVDSHKDAYMLFESLNNRGVPLSAVDLIKNTLIATSEKYNKSDECYEEWKITLSYLTDEYSTQERFFRQYYNAFREELNKPFVNENSTKKFPLAYLATRTTLLDIYDQLIKKDYNLFLENLIKETQIYSIIINNSDEEKIYKEQLLDLERIQGAPSYILLLYLLTKQDELNISDEQILKIIEILIKFFVRRNLTDIPNTRNLNKIFMDIIESIHELKGENVYYYIYNSLKQCSASDELFEEKLRGPIYDENPEATRFILCSIESMYQTKEIYTDLWSRDNSNKYIWTIEHVFPEGQNIPDSWVNMIADGDKNLAKKYLDDYVHTIGNLTITGYNQNLSNMSFEEKRNRKKDSKDIGYTNGLYLNKDIVNEEKWTVDKIKDRTDKLVNILLNKYKF